MSAGRGEFELIAEFRARLRRAGAPDRAPGLVLGSGDDAAISVHEGAVATSVDALVEGVHFRLGEFAPRSVGHKALAVALSDLAAMGALATEAYIQLGVPTTIPEPDLLELADGVGAAAAAHGVAIAGGDLTRAPVLVLAVTAVGTAADPGSLVRRSGACPGELAVVTGELGAAAAGRLLLERPPLAAAIAAPVAEALRRRQLEPEPRLAAGAALAAAGATAMIDLSDGIGGDARHLAAASRVRLTLEALQLPVQAGVDEVASAAGMEGLELALGGGEDYELLATIPAVALDRARAAVAAGGLQLTAIGAVEPGEGLAISGRAGEAPEGFDQLRSPPGPADPA